MYNSPISSTEKQLSWASQLKLLIAQSVNIHTYAHMQAKQNLIF